MTTARGWWKAPIMFLARGWLIPTFPPIELSTMARRVVGTPTQSTPLMYVAAAKPPMSPITPPPTATTSESLPRRAPTNAS
jgi:hypothetical protein